MTKQDQGALSPSTIASVRALMADISFPQGKAPTLERCFGVLHSVLKDAGETR